MIKKALSKSNSTSQATAETIEFRPQPGPQEMFLSTSADIALYGGAAGGGKSFAILLEPVRHIGRPGFGGVIFRRTSPQIVNEGGLWDQSFKMYPYLKAQSKGMPTLAWDFPNGNRIKFSHLQYDKDVYDFQGSEIPYEAFDELTHFTKAQFFYMLTRNRSTCGIRPYVRATTNPDPDSWVKELIAWWLDDKGDPIKARSGIIRFFIRIKGEIIWADTKQELIDKYHVGEDDPKSFTFIHADVFDNKILMEKDPGYIGNLRAQDQHIQDQLIRGNWNARPAGKIYSRTMFQIVDAIPADIVTDVRGWDEAATTEEEGGDPDWTASTRVAKTRSGKFIILDGTHGLLSPDEVDALQKSKASTDGVKVCVRLEQEPGSSGKKVAQLKVKMLAGYDVRVSPSTGSKLDKSRPAVAQAKVGNIMVLKGDWNNAFFTQLEAFGPSAAHDDWPDSFHIAFNECALGTAPGILDYYREELEREQAEHANNLRGAK